MNFHSDSDENGGFGISPGQYSPRPDPSEENGTYAQPVQGSNNPLAGYELKFNDNSPLNSSAAIGSGFGNSNDFSPRPGGGGFGGGMGSNAMSTPELAQLFGLITQFQPQPMEITPHFKPFLPELIPSIGAIDAFIKIPRPDDEQDPLGLTVLDEPTIGCSDPQILKMQLREKYGVVTNEGTDGYIGCIEDLDNNQKALDTFLESYEDINANRPPPTMIYSYKMPDYETLLQEWPPQMEEALNSLPLPTAETDLTIEEYTKVICALLDIPVKGNIIESLHVLFYLYEQFKEHYYFNQSRGTTPNPDANGNKQDDVDVLVL